MSPNQRRLLFWSPRILTIAYAIFLSLFALDVFSEGLSFWKTVLALMIHLIPTMVIVVALIVAWRWEWIGAVLYAGAAALYTVWALPKHPDWALFIAGPLLVLAGLFLANWFKRLELHASN